MRFIGVAVVFALMAVMVMAEDQIQKEELVQNKEAEVHNDQAEKEIERQNEEEDVQELSVFDEDEFQMDDDMNEDESA